MFIKMLKNLWILQANIWLLQDQKHFRDFKESTRFLRYNKSFFFLFKSVYYEITMDSDYYIYGFARAFKDYSRRM